jgi:predicted esterase
MHSQQIFIPTLKQCKVVYLGNPGSQIKRIWIVLHGYGQLAQYFIRNFESVSDDETLIVAPEGMSRFYLDGLSGRVGSSWMTKEEREREIDDNNAYLESVTEHILNLCEGAINPEINVLAFSQGVPVACRWLIRSKWQPKKFCLWAGALPHDVQLPLLRELFDEVKGVIVYGIEDEYITQIGAESVHHLIEKHKLQLEILTFEGGHKIDNDTLKKVFLS